MAGRARLKAVGGLQARGAKARPTLGITGTVVATVAELVTLWSPHSRGTLAQEAKSFWIKSSVSTARAIFNLLNDNLDLEICLKVSVPVVDMLTR